MAETARRTSPGIDPSGPIDGELVAEVAGVVYGALGCEDGAVLLRRSVERMRRNPPRGQSDCAGGGSMERALQQELLRSLARVRPELFGPRLRELGRTPAARGDALAVLYVQQQFPQALAPYIPSKHEADVLKDARELLQTHARADDEAKALGLDYTREPEYLVASRSCPLVHRHLRAAGAAGISLCPHAALRPLVILDGDWVRRCRRKDPEFFVSTLLHEGLHTALADAAKARPSAWAPVLTSLVDEAVVDTLAWVGLRLGQEPDWERMRTDIAAVGCGRRVLGLRSVLGALTPGSIVAEASALGVANLRAGSDEGTVQALNELTGRKWGVSGWRDRFESEYERFTVSWGDGAVGHYRGMDLNRYDGPAWQSTDGLAWYEWGGLSRGDDLPALITQQSVAWYRHGERHRPHRNGPALVVLPGHSVEIIPVEGAKTLTVRGPAQLHFEDGRLHRPVSTGPALLAGERGQRRQYWVNGKRVPAPAAKAPSAKNARPRARKPAVARSPDTTVTP
jgi:hypothetical protein